MMYKQAIYNQNMRELFAKSKALYDIMIRDGVAKECARFVLPLATPTRMYMNGTVRSWIHYINLRTANGTQKEHMDVANMCKDIFTKQLPTISEALGGMIDKATIEVTEADINQAYNSNYSPLQIAASRVMKVDKDRIEVQAKELLVWMYDDSDYILYKYSDEDSYVKVYDFINEWELSSRWIHRMRMERFRFEGDLISFNIEVDNDTRTHTNHWSGASLDFSGFDDESATHKKI